MIVHMAWVTCGSEKALIMLKGTYRLWSNMYCHLPAKVSFFFTVVTRSFI